MADRPFEFKPFSQKQKKLIWWWAEGSPHADLNMVIADGSIRSGKTVAMICGFFRWSFEAFPKGGAFILAGKTSGALKRNVINPARQILTSWGIKYHYISSGPEQRLEIGDNVYYLYDAHNERSQDRLQGLTACGALADEVALFPRNFVEQMIGRCSVDGAKLWLNCNPESPAHFVKQELIDRAAEKSILHLHFTMDDNLSLSEKVKTYFQHAFSGVFFRRFIKGEWALTDGLVYQQFADDPEAYIIDDAPRIQHAIIGMDFGGTGSAHSITLTGFTPGYREVVVLAEYYHNNKTSGVLTPAQLEAAFVDFVRRCQQRWPVYEAYCDSAEQTMIQGLRVAAAKAHLAIDIRNAVKGPINDRIAFFNSIIAQGRFRVHRGCPVTIKAMCDAVYDGKDPTKDVRLDDGTTNIDSLDALEYSVEKLMQTIMYLDLRG